MGDGGWFRKRQLTEHLAVYDEPFVHAFCRANMYHLTRQRHGPRASTPAWGWRGFRTRFAAIPASR